MSAGDKPRTVVCYGDSNTHGTVALTSLTQKTRFAPEARWTSILQRDLGAGFHVIVEGQPGRTTTLDDPVDEYTRPAFSSRSCASSTARP